MMNVSSFPAALVPLIAGWTRRLQARFPERPLKGLTRLANLINRLLPAYQGAITLANGSRMYVDSRQPAERWLLYSGNYQPALTMILKGYTPPEGVCFDVGANLGFYTVQFGQWVGSTGQVVAFEANPALMQRIEANVALNGFEHVQVVSAAIHDRAGEIEFHISSNPGKSSIRSIASAVETLVVPAITLDRYLSEHPQARLDVIKMDIEGNDCQALLGAAETLRRFRPLIAFEYKPVTPREIVEAALRLLASLDYDLWALSRDGTRRPFDALIKTDTDVVCVPPALKPDFR